ncbi:NF038215 family lipoprotein [Acinetobacter portensis]|uniref:NF038215 family lipoprotein n=1 Tax=Acinetobacter portensis TaxID=1839785 RepID=UPI0013D78446|nr:NF038215 family lipoprotein [Acinetobacter portensis]
MKNTALVLIIFGSFSLVACDTQTATEQLQLEARTMIIGGVPVHDKDYKIDETLNNQIQQK